MGFPEFHYYWEWLFQSSPEALWPLVSDTNHFNRDTRLPRIQDRRDSSDLNNARRLLRFTRMGVPIQWEELPFEWVRPQRFGVLRNYSSGPMSQMRVETELQPLPSGGTRIRYEVSATPRNLLGLIVIPLQIGIISARQFASAYRKYDMIASRNQWMSDQNERVTLVPGGDERLVDQVLDGGAGGVGRDRGQLVDLLRKLLEVGGSDLHITTNSPPQVRIHGSLHPLDLPQLTPADTKQLAYSVMTDAQGRYTLADLTAGEFGVLIGAPDYDTFSTRVRLSSNKALNVSCPSVAKCTLPEIFRYLSFIVLRTLFGAS